MQCSLIYITFFATSRSTILLPGFSALRSIFGEIVSPVGNWAPPNFVGPPKSDLCDNWDNILSLIKCYDEKVKRLCTLTWLGISQGSLPIRCGTTVNNVVLRIFPFKHENNMWLRTVWSYVWVAKPKFVFLDSPSIEYWIAYSIKFSRSFWFIYD